MKDQYQTISAPVEGDFKDRGSKFIAYAFPVYQQQDCSAHLDAIKKKHLKARHHCYAFRLGLDGNQFRANDDGEPSGTAGRPILGQIDSFGLTNLLVVVVRYFGGTKLGTSGLINAYKEAAKAALQKATIIEKTVEEVWLLDFEYIWMNEVMTALKKLDLAIVHQAFENRGTIAIAIPQSKVPDTLHQLKASILKKRLAEVPPEEEIEGIRMEYQSTR